MGRFVTEPEPVNIGLSFGGMLAVEITKLVNVKKLILILSVKTRNEEPWWMCASGKLKLHLLIKPQRHLKKLYISLNELNRGIKKATVVNIECKHFEDADLSGALPIDKSQGLKSLLEAIQKGKIIHFFVSDLDRLSRNVFNTT